VGITALVMGGFFVYYNYIESSPSFTYTQVETLETLGYPEQFAITYLEQGEAENRLVRQEVWFYPTKGQKLSFLQGELVLAEEMEVQPDYPKTFLTPDMFDIYSDLDDIKKWVGDINLAQVELPVFNDEGVETFMSGEAVFVFEQGYLTYVETIN
jgi:hypothetical protein